MRISRNKRVLVGINEQEAKEIAYDAIWENLEKVFLFPDASSSDRR